MQPKNRILMTIAALGIGLGSGWMLPAQAPADPAKGPQWKDRAEYDLADAYTKATDAKGRLASLDKWAQANPDSEMFAMRDEWYLGTYGEVKDNRKAFDKAKAMRAKNPNHYLIWNYVYLSMKVLSNCMSCCCSKNYFYSKKMNLGLNKMDNFYLLHRYMNMFHVLNLKNKIHCCN